MREIFFLSLRTLLRALLNLVYVLGSCVPRDNRRWLFGGWNGRKFLDNPKYIFLYVVEHCPSVRACWITKDTDLAAALREKGLPAAYAYSPRGLWLQLRAGLAVFTHSAEWDFFAPLLAARVKRVQTWHGMPIKMIGYDDLQGTRSTRDHTRLLTRLFPFRNNRLDLALAAGPADKERFETAFNIEASAVVITGYPRNDALIRSMGRKAAERSPRRVIYMPTLRGLPGSDFTLFRDTLFNFEAMDATCGQLGIEFWIKLHPVQGFANEDLDAIRRCKNLRPYTETTDIYEVIGRFDILITDFSGIYFDYLISGRPIVMAPLDMGSYLKNDRSLYYPYEELCPDSPCDSWEQVFARIAGLLESGVAPGARYFELQKRFHVYLDDESSERAYRAIERMLADGRS